MPFGHRQAVPAPVELLLQCGDSSLCLLLVGMQDMDRRLETDHADGPRSVAVMVRDDLQHPSAKPRGRLDIAVPKAGLGVMERERHTALRRVRKPFRIRLSRSHPLTGFGMLSSVRQPGGLAIETQVDRCIGAISLRPLAESDVDDYLPRVGWCSRPVRCVSEQAKCCESWGSSC